MKDQEVWEDACNILLERANYKGKNQFALWHTYVNHQPYVSHTRAVRFSLTLNAHSLVVHYADKKRGGKVLIIEHETARE